MHLAVRPRHDVHLSEASQNMLRGVTSIASHLETRFRHADLRARIYKLHLERGQKRVLRHATAVPRRQPSGSESVADSDLSRTLDWLFLAYGAKDAGRYLTPTEAAERLSEKGRAMLRPRRLFGKAYEAEVQRRRDVRDKVHSELEDKLSIDPESPLADETRRLLRFDHATDLELERALTPAQLLRKRRESKVRLNAMRCWEDATLSPAFSDTDDPSDEHKRQASQPRLRQATRRLSMRLREQQEALAEQAWAEDAASVHQWLQGLEESRSAHLQAVRSGAIPKGVPPPGPPSVVRRLLAGRPAPSVGLALDADHGGRGRHSRHQANAVNALGNPLRRGLLRCSVLVTGSRKRKELAAEREVQDAELLNAYGVNTDVAAEQQRTASSADGMNQEAMEALVDGLRLGVGTVDDASQQLSPQAPDLLQTASSNSLRPGRSFRRTPSIRSMR